MRGYNDSTMWRVGSGPAKADPYDEGKVAGPSDEGKVAGPSDEGKVASPPDEGKVRGNATYPRRKSLRNANINYRAGWWAVTVQVAKNKSILGTIVGDKVVLNGLGREVEDYWRELPAKYPELELFDFVVMPNHIHALLRIHWRATNREHHLGFLMSRFKGGTGYIYGKMRRAGEVEDIGDQLWQRDYWDDLISGDDEFAGWRKYILENPANWSSDRYGACTTYMFGDPELLNAPRIAFVASQGFFASELRPRRIYGSGNGPAKAGPSDKVRSSSEGAASAAPVSGAASAAPPVLISTFTSAQEREALRRALAKGRRLIAVFPQGIPPEGDLPPALLAASRAGQALLLSPQPPGSRLNKKIATWCNEYVLRHADEIWVGDISPNGMLSAMLQGLGRETGRETGRLKPAPQMENSGEEENNHAH